MRICQQEMASLETGAVLTIMSRMRNSRTCGARSMDGALVKLSTMKRKTEAARRKLSTEASRPCSVFQSWRAPICVCSAPKLNSTHAFTEREKNKKTNKKKRLRTLAYLVSSAETPKRALLIGYRFLDNQ